jgi:DNA-binding NarL/FixJ family response regulator
MKKIKVLIADDHKIVRMGLAALLATERDLQLVGEAENGVETVRLASSLKPDVLIMDLMMPKKDGVEATRETLAASPGTKVLVLTSYGTSNAVAQAIEAGAAGALMKTADDAQIVSVIRRLAAGEKYISPEIRQSLKNAPTIPVLSPRQAEVLKQLTLGLTNKEIADVLGIRKDGVEDHIKIIFSKLGASNRAEAVAIALRKHLLKI